MIWQCKHEYSIEYKRVNSGYEIAYKQNIVNHSHKDIHAVIHAFYACSINRR